MFWKKKEKETMCVISTSDGILTMNQATYDYVCDLRMKLSKMTDELTAIKPILESPDLKPALSKHCDDCRFVVYSPYTSEYDVFGNPIHRTILGCRRNSLCSYYLPHEEIKED